MFGHTKWIFYAATCYTWLGDDEPAEEHVRELIARHTQSDGSSNAPMRTALSHIDLGLIRARHGDLDEAVHHGLTVFSYDRKTDPSAVSRCTCDALPNLAVLDQGGAAARRRWPGVSAALCLGRPARRTPGHSRKIRQISRAHSRRRPGACSRPVLLRPVPGRRYQEDGGTPGCSLRSVAHSAARRVVRPFPTNPVGAKLAGRAPCPAEKRVHSSLKERAAQRASLGSHPCRSEVPLNGHWEASTALKFPGLWGLVSGFLMAGHGLDACWRGGVTGSGGP